MIKAITFFLIGAAVLAYSLEVHSFLVGYIGLGIMSIGGMLLLIWDCDRDDLMNGGEK